MLVSVAICTHNPRPDFLQRVLQALGEQTLPMNQWELLLIDNGSDNVLADQWDLSWHPNARHIREDELGLTSARLRGIGESTGELLVFVDDDNVLAPEYLESALMVYRERPYIGAFGASITGEFESPPPRSIENYLVYLALEELRRDYWSNLPFHTKAFPLGAGLCVNRAVANAYYACVQQDARRRRLDRAGQGLGAHGDTDLLLTATDLGLGTGRFQCLRLIHLIPKRRLTEDYIVGVVSGAAGSYLLLKSVRNIEDSPAEPKWVAMAKLAWRLVRANRLQRRIIRETRRAEARTRRLLQSAPQTPDRFQQLYSS